MFKVIDGFETLTMQQAFDMAAAHIGKTGKKSMRYGDSSTCPVPMCCYSDSGCNASVFIKPEFHGELDFLEDPGWEHLVYNGHVPNHLSSFIPQLQNAHDDTFDGERFRDSYLRNMRQLAEDYGLYTDGIDELARDWE